MSGLAVIAVHTGLRNTVHVLTQGPVWMMLATAVGAVSTHFFLSPYENPTSGNYLFLLFAPTAAFIGGLALHSARLLNDVRSLLQCTQIAAVCSALGWAQEQRPDVRSLVRISSTSTLCTILSSPV